MRQKKNLKVKPTENMQQILMFVLTGSKRNSKKGQGVDKKEEEKETTESEISNTSTPLRCVKLAFLSASFIS